MELLTPDSSEWTAVVDRPPLGSLLWLDPSRGAIAALEALEFAVDNPWIPVLVTGPASVARAFQHRAPHPDLVIHAPLVQLAPEDALQYVSRSTAPTADSIARWIADRCRMPTVEPFLATLMGDLPSPPWATLRCSRREFYRRATRLGPLRPGDWRRLSALARQQRRAEISVDHLASNVGVGLKALRRQVARLVGVRVATYRKFPGWAWVLEATLRRHGILVASGPDASPRIARPHLAGYLGRVETPFPRETIPAPRGTAPHLSIPAQRDTEGRGR